MCFLLTPGVSVLHRPWPTGRARKNTDEPRSVLPPPGQALSAAALPHASGSRTALPRTAARGQRVARRSGLHGCPLLLRLGQEALPADGAARPPHVQRLAGRAGGHRLCLYIFYTYTGRDTRGLSRRRPIRLCVSIHSDAPVAPVCLSTLGMCPPHPARCRRARGRWTTSTST